MDEQPIKSGKVPKFEGNKTFRPPSPPAQTPENPSLLRQQARVATPNGFRWLDFLPFAVALLAILGEFQGSLFRFGAIALGIGGFCLGAMLVWRRFDQASWLSLRQKRAWLTLLAASTLTVMLGILLPYVPDPLSPSPDFPTAAWWRYRPERNAFLRSTDSPGRITSIGGGIDGGDLWAVGDAGLLIRSADGGKTWGALSRPTTNDLHSIWFLDSQRGFAVGAARTAIRTRDGGVTWEPIRWSSFEENAKAPVEVRDSASATALTLHRIRFANDRFGIIAGSGGFVCVSRDGGDTWRRLPVRGNPPGQEPVSATFRDIVFGGPTWAWLVGDHQLALRMQWSEKGDPSDLAWDRIDVKAPNLIRAVAGPEATLLALTDTGDTLLRRDDTQPWEPVGWTHGGYVASEIRVKDLLRVQTNRWFLLTSRGNLGEILLDRIPSKIESFAEKNIKAPVAQQAPVQARAGTEIALRGLTLDYVPMAYGSGAALELGNPQEVQGRNSSPLETLWQVNGDRVLAAGALEIAGTEGNSELKHLPFSHRGYPAPLFWMLALLSVSCTGVLALVQVPGRAPVTTRPDYAVSDVPIENASQDRLGFAEISQGIASFLRNPNTEPPLTIAITGEWGSGKSSILSMVRSVVRQSHFPTVWFNAWHHQNEEQLFAVLLKNVVEQGVPPMWSQSGLQFRARLYAQRVRRRWLWSLFWVGLFIALSMPLLGLFFREVKTLSAPPPPPATNEIVATHLIITPNTTNTSPSLTDVVRTGVKLEWQTPKPPEEKRPETLIDLFVNWLGNYVQGHGSWTKWLGWFLVAGTAAWRFWGQLRAFGIEPASLMARARDGTRLADLGAKASFQLQFAEQFREVTSAMGDQQLVIFIDDLDRCQPSKVATMLEAISFLIVSGRCFVVMGFARRQVESAVGLAFAEMAGETNLAGEDESNESRKLASTGGPPKRASDGERLARENRRAFAALYLKKLINLEVEVPSPTDDRAVGMLTQRLPAGIPARSGLSTASADSPALSKAEMQKKTFLPLVIGLVFGLQSAFGEISDAKSAAKEAQTQQRARTMRGATASARTSFHWWWVLPPGLCTVAGCAAVLRRRPKEEAFDPPEMHDALRAWLPWIRARYASPRELKRYMNLVRFLVMRTASEDSQKVLQGRFGGVSLDAPEIVRLSAQAVRRPDRDHKDDQAVWEACSRRHRETFRSEPDPKSEEAFAWLCQNLRLN